MVRSHVEQASIRRHVRNVPMFSVFSQKDLEKVAKAGDHMTARAGTVITTEGQDGHEAFVVLGGTVTVRRDGADVAELGPGSIVGELSLLDHGPRTATVACATDCDLFVLSSRASGR